jgi:Domain of unknown function (DUF4382)
MRFTFAFAFALVVVTLFFAACGGSSGQTATVTTSLSDPSTCSSPQGPYRHIYVTITDVQTSQSANIGNGNSGWVDLTPTLKDNPVQVDLLGVANQCFLSTLGSTGIPAGSYQQIRVILAKDGIAIANNKCGAAANCVMLTSDPSNTPIPLLLSSESNNGIKIPSGQIAGGQFSVKGGDNKDLNIDFNACASMVVQGTGQYRLKPVLHAGEVELQSTATAISGTAIDLASGQAVVGGATVIALEQKDSLGVDRVIMETVAASNGGFSFCPVPAGSYDIVISAINGNGVAYAATVITGVQPGDNLGNVPLTAVGAPASITGQVTTTNGGAAAADLQLSALQAITVNNANMLITTPLAQQSAAAVSLPTLTGSCPANTDCANYTLGVPASNPSIGTFVAGAMQTPLPPTPSNVTYTIDAVAFIPGSAGQTDCSPSEQQTSQTNTNAPLVVTVGASVTAHPLAFTGCN